MIKTSHIWSSITFKSIIILSVHVTIYPQISVQSNTFVIMLQAEVTMMILAHVIIVIHGFIFICLFFLETGFPFFIRNYVLYLFILILCKYNSCNLYTFVTQGHQQTVTFKTDGSILDYMIGNKINIDILKYYRHLKGILTYANCFKVHLLSQQCMYVCLI